MSWYVLNYLKINRQIKYGYSPYQPTKLNKHLLLPHNKTI